MNHFNKGLVLSKLDNLKAANKSLTTAREKFGNDKSNLLYVYFCRYNLGINYRKLQEYEKHILEINPDYIKGLNFKYVTDMFEVLHLALEPANK